MKGKWLIGQRVWWSGPGREAFSFSPRFSTRESATKTSQCNAKG
jgi:hypothetical protein